jgi:hypothetical protein
MMSPLAVAGQLTEEQLAKLPPHRLVFVRIIARVEYLNGEQTEVGVAMAPEQLDQAAKIVEAMQDTQTPN